MMAYKKYFYNLKLILQNKSNHAGVTKFVITIVNDNLRLTHRARTCLDGVLQALMIQYKYPLNKGQYHIYEKEIIFPKFRSTDIFNILAVVIEYLYDISNYENYNEIKINNLNKWR